MTVILVGQRSDGTPLVLVRCRCGYLRWLTQEQCGRLRGCGRGCRTMVGPEMPTLTQALLLEKIRKALAAPGRPRDGRAAA